MKKQRQTNKRKEFRQAIQTELREHKSSFLVFSVLRFLIIAIFARQILLHAYESAFYCILAFCLLYLPSLVKLRLRISLPPLLEICVLCFIFAAEILGEVDALYLHIRCWDTMLHTINGFLAAAVGFSMVTILNNDRNLSFHLSPFFMALMAFCFSMTIGVLWEFFEFGADLLLHSDMQKDTIVSAIYSVELNPEGLNHAVGLTGIQSVAVNGKELGLGGYLDIGLIDTMKDLIVNFIGAVVFSVFGYFYSKSHGKNSRVVESLIPKRKHAE